LQEKQGKIYIGCMLFRW